MNDASHDVGSAPRKSQPKSCTAHVSGGNAARPGVSVPAVFVDSPPTRVVSDHRCARRASVSRYSTSAAVMSVLEL